MNVAGVPFTRKDEVSLWTWPVGPWLPVAVVGMATVGGTGVTPAAVTAYSVLTLVFISETEKRPVSLNDVPHGFLRRGSVSWARPGMSEIRLVWTYPVWEATARLSARVTPERVTWAPVLRRPPPRVTGPKGPSAVVVSARPWAMVRSRIATTVVPPLTLKT